MSSTNKTILGIVALVIIAAIAYATFNRHFPDSSKSLSIDASSANYGQFIDNQDSGYFSTTDANVKNIIQAYLTNPTGFSKPTDAQKYGFSSIYYYVKNNFIVGEKADPSGSVNAYTMYDVQTGQKISTCSIIPSAGLYKDNDLLLSVALIDGAPSGKNGICRLKKLSGC